MPNWCENELKVVSKTKTALQKFMRAISCRDDDTVFKINNIVPIPEPLMSVSAGSDETLYECLHATGEKFENFCKLYKLSSDTNEGAFVEYVDKYWNTHHIDKSRSVDVYDGKSKLEKARLVVEQYKSNMDTYGHLTWYTWCITNWGTKWDVCDSSIGDIECSRTGKTYNVSYSFNTAWTPPLKAIETISRIYSGLIFKLHYYEGGCGFKGRFTAKGGNVIKNETFEYNGHRGG